MAPDPKYQTARDVKSLADEFSAYRLLVDLHMQAVADRLEAIEKRLRVLEYPPEHAHSLTGITQTDGSVLPWPPIKEIK